MYIYAKNQPYALGATYLVSGTLESYKPISKIFERKKDEIYWEHYLSLAWCPVTNYSFVT